jgi:hypothetical protein
MDNNMAADGAGLEGGAGVSAALLHFVHARFTKKSSASTISLAPRLDPVPSFSQIF